MASSLTITFLKWFMITTLQLCKHSTFSSGAWRPWYPELKHIAFAVWWVSLVRHGARTRIGKWAKNDPTGPHRAESKGNSGASGWTDIPFQPATFLQPQTASQNTHSFKF
jgi:hypothetical protein